MKGAVSKPLLSHKIKCRVGNRSSKVSFPESNSESTSPVRTKKGKKQKAGSLKTPESSPSSSNTSISKVDTKSTEKSRHTSQSLTGNTSKLFLSQHVK